MVTLDPNFTMGDCPDGSEFNPDGPELFAPPSQPTAVADQLLPDWSQHGELTLRNWRGNWMRWHGPHWAEAEDRDIRAVLYGRLKNAVYVAINKDGEPEERPWAPTKRKIGDLSEALAAATHLPSTVNAPAWLDAESTIAGADSPIVACSNGLLDVATRSMTRHSPAYFNLVSVPFDYDPDAPEPTRWLQFLKQLWPDDPDTITALQEFFGYVLSGRTDLHKIVLIVGPTRSGKGTIARVLTAMIGKANVSGPTLASLTTNFGLSALLGKPLAVISDARMAGRDTNAVVERLLTVSGEDTIDVDRKYQQPWTGKLPTRFLILSNELPNFGDSSGAIAHRFVVLSMQRSFLGHEDTALTDTLTEELPGILNWSLDGLARINRTGRFTEPAGSTEAVVAMKDTASPMSAFLRERCTIGAGHEVEVDTLWTAWKSWCEDNERRPGNKQLFGRNVRSAAPQIKIYRATRDDGTREPRRYRGVTLADPFARETHNGTGRGPSRSGEYPEDHSDAETTQDRDGPRPDPLWDSHESDREDASDASHESAPSTYEQPRGYMHCARCGHLGGLVTVGGERLCPDCRTTQPQEQP